MYAVAPREGRGAAAGSGALEAGEYHPFLPSRAGGAGFGHKGLPGGPPGTQLAEQPSNSISGGSQRQQHGGGGGAAGAQTYKPPAPAPLHEDWPDR